MKNQNWTYKKLGDVATYVNGFAFKPDDWKPQGTPIIRIQNLNDDNASFNYFSGKVPDKFVVEDGDLLISWSASLGVYEWKRGRALLNQHIFKVVFDKGNIDKFFLKYAVTAQLDNMAKNTHGATMKHIVKKDFDNTPIPVPPLPTQRAIVAELDTLNEILDKKRQQLKELDTLAQSIFYDMFGDPVENEKGWEVKELNTVCDVRDGTHDSPKYIDGGDYILITSKNIVDGKIDYSNVSYITKEDYDAINKRSKVDDGDIIMAMIGTIGKPIIVKMEGYRFCIKNVALIKFLEDSLVSNIYIQALLSSTSFAQHIISKNQGGTQKFVALGTIRKLEIPLPPLSLQQSFAQKIEAIEKQNGLINASIKEVETLLNATMDKYFG